MKKRFGLAVLLMGAALLQAQENYTTNWTGHRTVGVNTGATGANVTANVLKFPVLVRLGAADSAVFLAAKGSGADVRFTKSNNTTRLPHQIESWDSAGRSAAIWVLMDTVKASSVNALRMHWANASAVDSSNGPAVFDTANKFQAVWHMKAASGNESDATANNFTLTAGTSSGNAPTNIATGAVGTARGFDGTQKFFVALNTASSVLNFPEGGPFTISSWVTRAAANTSNRVILNKSDIAYGLQQSSTQKAEGCDLIGTTTQSWQCVDGPILSNDTWYHMVYVRKASGAAKGSGILYLNGVAITDSVVASTPSGTTGRGGAANVHVGADRSASYPGDETGTTTNRRRWWNGNIDEVRMSNTVRDSNWVKLEYATQKATGAAVSEIVAVTNLAYGDTAKAADTVVFSTGIAVNLLPTFKGGPVDSFAITSATTTLPTGLTFNKATGAITGTATATFTAGNRTVTAYSLAGNTTRTVRVSAILGNLTNLHYTLDTATYPAGLSVTNTPSSSGRAATGYSVSPALPTGLVLDTVTGVISGTPTTATAVATYTVKAKNATDTTTVGLRITIGAAEDFTTWSQHKDWWINTQPNGANVAKAVINFPVLVRLDSTNFAAGFAQVAAGGADLRFSKANNATRLPHQIDTWDSAGKQASIWVLVDSIPAGGVKALRMHWGKVGAPNTSSGPAVFRTADGFKAVWHMNGATTANELDATANNLTAVQTSGPVAVAGIVGGARNFVNTTTTATDYFTATGSAATLTFPVNGNYTVSAWTNLTTQVANATLVSKSDNAYAMKLNANLEWEFFEFNAGWNAVSFASEGSVWHHLVGVQNGADAALYVDGVRADYGILSTASTAARVDTYDLVLGGQPTSNTARSRPYNGMADEIRIAGVSRDTAWATLEYQNQKPSQSLVYWSQPVAIGANNAAAQMLGFGFSAKGLGEGMIFRVQGNQTGHIKITMTDMRGRPVWSHTAASTGRNDIVWNGTTSTGQRVSNGIYALRVTFLDAQNKVLQTLDRKLPFTR